MAIRIWVLEGMVYRTAALIDDALSGVDIDNVPGILKSLREYAVECSIVKVFGSETLDYVVDETVQIHGGYGFSADYPVERYYRDSRVYRIFEGTNEINRLMISGMLLKQTGSSSGRPENSGESVEGIKILHAAKAAFAALSLAATQKYGETFYKNGEEQEVQLILADIAIDIYAMETAYYRSRNEMPSGAPAEVRRDIAAVFLNDARIRIANLSGQILARLDLAKELTEPILSALVEWSPLDSVAARRRIAQYLLSSGRYSVSR
jgi:alkylation response protein AidB-like acyl-CoA dehydrogenase